MVVPFVSSLLPIDSSKGPKLRTFRLTVHRIFSPLPALGMEPRYGTSRSRRQLDGLWPKACRKSLHRCAWSENPTLRAISLSEVRTGDHQMAGLLQPPPHHVSMRRFSEGLFERTREVRRASLRDSTEIPGVDRAVQIPFDKSSHACDLPARQRAAASSRARPRWRSISDCRMVDAVASDAFAASRSRSSSRLAVSRSWARLLAK